MGVYAHISGVYTHTSVPIQSINLHTFIVPIATKYRDVTLFNILKHIVYIIYLLWVHNEILYPFKSLNI